MKEAILNAAAALFSEKGFAGTEMDDVAVRANVTKETLHYHFRNKSQLFGETILRHERLFEERVVESASGSYTVDSISMRIVGLCVDFFTDYKNIADMIITEKDADESVIADIRTAKNRFIDLIAYLIGEGIAKGRIRSCNSRITASAMIYYVYAYCSLLAENGGYDKEAAAVRICDILMNGMKK